MSRPLKRMVDGFFFGIGLALALALVLGTVLLCATAYMLKRGGDAISDALSFGQSLEEVEGVYLVSTNLTKVGDALFLSAALTNATSQNFEKITLMSTLTGQAGEHLDFKTSTLTLLGARSQTNLTIVFDGAVNTNSVESLSFGLDIFVDSDRQ